MDEKTAMLVLEEFIQPDGSLYSLGRYLSWNGEATTCLDARFTETEMEAIAWWMRHKTVTKTAGRGGQNEGQ